MTRSYRPQSRSRSGMAAMILLLVAVAPAARAQEIGEEEAVVVPAAPVGGGVLFNEAQFDQWVFGNFGPGNATAARAKLDALLTLTIEDIARTCALAPAQKRKLLLAGKGD